MDQNNFASLISNLSKQARLLRMENAEIKKAVQLIQQGQHYQLIPKDHEEAKLPNVLAKAPVTNLIYYTELLEKEVLKDSDTINSTLMSDNQFEINDFKDTFKQNLGL
ncbi:hypothetical protein BB561_004150 [Smittium simulii]|uniref:Uncharacterized protein n=1 Tax=Smittium simulii TaxID=133385 RepID=A0A2T9YHW1_9FUNG|nr:hypothetical protein BB561_004150 [Smittium simulii]